MPIPEKQVVVGGEYLTDTHQQRKVTKFTKDGKNRTRVVYLAKSSRIPNRDYAPCPTLSNPPLIKTFAKACSRRIR